MPKFTKNNARIMARSSCRNREYRRGKFIVAYKLNRKNAKRHECYRSDSLEDCVSYVVHKCYTDRYFQIYTYDWQPVGQEKLAQAIYNMGRGEDGV